MFWQFSATGRATSKPSRENRLPALGTFHFIAVFHCRTSRHGDPKRGRDLDWRVRILIRKVNQLGTCFGLPSPICCASCGFSDHPPVRVKKEDPPIGLGSDSTDKVPRKVSKPFRRSRRVPNHDSTPKLGSAQEERIERSTRR